MNDLEQYIQDNDIISSEFRDRIVATYNSKNIGLRFAKEMLKTYQEPEAQNDSEREE